MLVYKENCQYLVVKGQKQGINCFCLRCVSLFPLSCISPCMEPPRVSDLLLLLGCTLQPYTSYPCTLAPGPDTLAAAPTLTSTHLPYRGQIEFALVDVQKRKRGRNERGRGRNGRERNRSLGCQFAIHVQLLLLSPESPTQNDLFILEKKMRIPSMTPRGLICTNLISDEKTQ